MSLVACFVEFRFVLFCVFVYVFVFVVILVLCLFCFVLFCSLCVYAFLMALMWMARICHRTKPRSCFAKYNITFEIQF